jgi:hypothetical protein
MKAANPFAIAWSIACCKLLPSPLKLPLGASVFFGATAAAALGEAES